MMKVYYFNPGHENAVLNVFPSYTAPANMVIIMSELSALPAWYANSKDVVLVSDEYHIDYMNKLKAIGFNIASTLYINDLREYNELNLYLWGISSHAIRFFDNLKKSHFLNFILPEWNEKLFYMNSRIFSKDVLTEIKSKLPHFSEIVIPQFVTDVQSVESILSNSSVDLLVKSPYSSSGRGLLWIPTSGMTRTEKQVLTGMLNKQQKVSAEPVYDKILDFAMEFLLDENGGLTFEGYSLFSTNERGAYSGNVLRSQIDIVNKLTNYIDIDILENVKELLCNILSIECKSIYNGCIGIDMMIVKVDNYYCLHPCVEINLRYNMGYLSIKLYENFVSQTSAGKYLLDFDPKGNTFIKHKEMENKYPLVMSKGRIESGYLSLCPVTENTKYRAYMLIEKL